MPRKLRLSTPGWPMHIVQRGNNRQDIFFDDQERYAYLNLLRESAEKYSVCIHAWVLMTNHTHLLCTPLEEHACSKLMQSLGGNYATYFNKKHGRTGTVWGGRYRSGQILDDSYLLCTYRYIELNPLRARMVAHPANYPWSSYRSNALGINDHLTSPHDLYLAMGTSPEQRQRVYQSLFEDELKPSQIDNIRRQLAGRAKPKPKGVKPKGV